jgi:hypothetical protein
MKIPSVKGTEDTVSPSYIVYPLQVEKNFCRVLVHEETILDMVLQLHEVVKNESVVLKPTLNIQK